jgi:hypothetical protein
MAQRPLQRRARITLRCLKDDLSVTVPPITESIETLPERNDLGESRQVIQKFFELAPAAPQNQDRVLTIRDRPVFRFKFAAYRAATWLDDDNVEWLCAVAIRREDSDDAYDHFEGLHAAGKLLPGEHDRVRDRLELDARRLLAVTREAPDLLERAMRTPGEEIATRLGAFDVAVYAVESGGLMEVWIAVSRRDPESEGFFPDALVLQVFAIFGEAIGTELHQEMGEWPTRRLEWFETARLYVA